uniref:Ig-like domain-containing protein n=1 Tax=Gopherus agassizii TaxID=38772 RepID=A0A452HSQ8_9SAUR
MFLMFSLNTVGSVLFSPSLSAGPSATAQKSTLTLDPPWSIVFKGESVTLTCSTSHPPGRRFTWYRNNKVFRSTEINSLKIKYAQENDAGRYQCQIFPGGPNWLGPLGMDPVGPCCNSPLALDVSLSDWLILQVPYYGVFEGDPLCLRCYGWKGARVSRIRYYRDGADVTPSHVNSELSIKQARTRDSGKYHCTGSMKTGIMLTKLFSTPVLRAAGSGDPIEGSSVTLSCVTQLNPQKLDTPLQRFFYKDSRALGEPRSSPDYHIPVAGLQDSGSYHCEVQTVTSSVWKQSPKLKIAVKRECLGQGCWGQVLKVPTYLGWKKTSWNLCRAEIRGAGKTLINSMVQNRASDSRRQEQQLESNQLCLHRAKRAQHVRSWENLTRVRDAGG